jgi:peptidoglycan LD-endopeptidase CwlK
MKLTATSLKRLKGVHPDLVKVVKRAAEITKQDFQVIEGVRTLARQRQLVKRGASRTLRSRHIPAPNGLGHAVDLVAMVGGRVSWEVPLYHVIADAMRLAARQLGVRIEWGGDWKGFFDGPHFQLPWAEYPGVHAVSDPAPEQPTIKEMATLVPGSHGEDIVALQSDLTRMGFILTPDGQFGPTTRAAVIAASARLLGDGKATHIVTSALRDKIARAARAAEGKR